MAERVPGIRVAVSAVVAAKVKGRALMLTEKLLASKDDLKERALPSVAGTEINAFVQIARSFTT
jgi:hypothetical protein